MKATSRTYWIGIGVMLGTAASIIGQQWSWYERPHWAWGVFGFVVSGLIGWRMWRKEMRE